MMKYKLKRSIFFTFSIIFTVVICIACTYFYIFSLKQFYIDEKNMSRQLSQNVSSQIDELYGQMSVVTASLANSPMLQKLVYEMNFNEDISQYESIKNKRDIESLLGNVMINLPVVDNVMLYNHNKGYFYNTGIILQDYSVINKTLKDEGWYKNILIKSQPLFIDEPRQSRWSKKDNYVISAYYKMLPNDNIKNSILEVQVPYSKIAELCSVKTENEKGILVLISKEGNVIYPKVNNAPISSKVLESINKDIHNSTDSITLKKAIFNNGYYQYYTSKNTGITAVYVKENSIVNLQFKHFTLVAFIITLSLILISCIGIYFLTEYLTKPIKVLLSNIKKANKYIDMNNLQEVKTDEIKVINDSFDKMFLRLTTSIEEVYVSHLRETKAHLSALQAQINPHFICNTLNAIGAAAKFYDSDVTEKMCKQLADMMRYITSNNVSNIQLCKEIEHTRNYLELMRIPNEGNLTYSIDIDDKLYNIHVPKLILQPIVENCIKYAFNDNLPPWDIKIKGERLTNSHCLISVEDNGKGFNEEEIEGIKKDLQALKNSEGSEAIHEKLEIGGLGLVNIYARLLIVCNKHVDIHIENKQQGGSKISLIIPINNIS